MQDSSASHSIANRFIIIFLILGFLVTAYIVVFDWEYSLLKAEMGLIDTLLLSTRGDPARLVDHGGVISYLSQAVVWFSILALLGLLWSKIFFPKQALIEKIIFALPFGLIIMPLSFVLPAFIISAGKIIAGLTGAALPAYYTPIVIKVVELISSNQEQSYEIANVLAFFALGFIILAGKKLLFSRK